MAPTLGVPQPKVYTDQKGIVFNSFLLNLEPFGCGTTAIFNANANFVFPQTTRCTFLVFFGMF